MFKVCAMKARSCLLTQVLCLCLLAVTFAGCKTTEGSSQPGSSGFYSKRDVTYTGKFKRVLIVSANEQFVLTMSQTGFGNFLEEL